MSFKYQDIEDASQENKTRSQQESKVRCDQRIDLQQAVDYWFSIAGPWTNNAPREIFAGPRNNLILIVCLIYENDITVH